MAFNQKAVMEPVIIKFTNLSQELGWKDYQELFSQFGKVNKLYIDPLGKFGNVHFLNSEDAYRAQKELDGKSPYNLACGKPFSGESFQLSSFSSNTSSSTNSATMYRRGYNRYNNDDDVDVLPTQTQYVDVYGRVLDTLESEDGREIYVPISDLKKSGFEVFRRGTLPKPGESPVFDEQLIQQHELYLKIKSKKFIMDTLQTLPQDRINGVVQRLQNECRAQYYQGALDNEARSVKVTSPNFTSYSNTPQNMNYKRGRSQDRRSTGGQERRTQTTYSNNSNSYSTDNNWSDRTAKDSSGPSNNFQSRRSYNEGNTRGGSSQGRNRNYNNNKNGFSKTSTPAAEPVNNMKPLVREQLARNTPQEVEISYLENEYTAWVQLSSNFEFINNIMVQTMDEAPDADVIAPAIDKICAALCGDIWFRVLIISTYPLTVQFIDFGSIKNTADIKELRKLSSNLSDIPGQAIRICIEFGADITLKPFMKFIVIPIMQVEDGTYLVRAQKLPTANQPQKPNVSFAEDVECDTKSAPSSSVTQPNLRRSNVSFPKDVESDTKSTPSSSVTQPSLRRPHADPPQDEIKPEEKTSPARKIVADTSGDTHAIKAQRKIVIEDKADSGYFDCTEIVNENTFVGVAMPATYVEEVCILDEITNDCKPDPSFTPNLGDTVAVLKDDAYVRGVVVNNLNKHYTCALIDYGLTISVAEVCPLPDKFMNIPEFACLCKADNDTIQEISKGNEHLMEIKTPGQVLVTIKDSGKVCEVAASRWDAFETSALAIKKTEHVEEKPIKKPLVKKEEDKHVEENPIKKPLVKKEEDIYKGPVTLYQLKPSDVVIIISEVEGSLIVRTRECNIALKDINQELNNYQGKPFGRQPEVNQLVVCPFTDGALYRGIVRSINNSNAVCEYIDFGNCETVPIKDLRTINEKLANLPSTCLKISLKEFVKTKFSLQALKYLEDCATRREKFDIVSENDGQVYDLLFKDKKGSLSEKLLAFDKPPIKTLPPAVKPHVEAPSSPVTPPPTTVKRSQPSPSIVTPSQPAAPPASSLLVITDIPRCNLKLGENEVMCLFPGDLAEGTASFCIADPAIVEKKMLELSEKTNAHVETDLTPYYPTKFEVCLAKFEDEWYRAAFIKECGDSFGMFYLDYGNTSTVTAENIRKMPNELAKIECLSALCILQGVKQNDEPVKDPLLTKLVTSVMENEFYKINVLKEENSCYIITIPSLYNEWKKEGLLS